MCYSSFFYLATCIVNICYYTCLFLLFFFFFFGFYFVVVCILHHVAVAINSFITTILSLLLLLLLFIALYFFSLRSNRTIWTEICINKFLFLLLLSMPPFSSVLAFISRSFGKCHVFLFFLFCFFSLVEKLPKKNFKFKLNFISKWNEKNAQNPWKDYNFFSANLITTLVILNGQ